MTPREEATLKLLNIGENIVPKIIIILAVIIILVVVIEQIKKGKEINFHKIFCFSFFAIGLYLFYTLLFSMATGKLNWLTKFIFENLFISLPIFAIWSILFAYSAFQIVRYGSSQE